MLRRLLQLAAVAALVTACDTRVPGLVGVTAPPTHITFTSQPSDVQVGNAMLPAVRVEVQNGQGQTVTSGSVNVVLTIVPGTGAPGATLIGGDNQVSVSGVVLFTNIRIDTPGTGYQLLASATGFPSVASVAFNVTP